METCNSKTQPLKHGVEGRTGVGKAVVKCVGQSKSRGDLPLHAVAELHHANVKQRQQCSEVLYHQPPRRQCHHIEEDTEITVVDDREFISANRSVRRFKPPTVLERYGNH